MRWRQRKQRDKAAHAFASGVGCRLQIMNRFRPVYRIVTKLVGRLGASAITGDRILFVLAIAAVAATLIAIAVDVPVAFVSAAGLSMLMVLAAAWPAPARRRLRAHSPALRRAPHQFSAKRLSSAGICDRHHFDRITSDALVSGDLVLVEADETIPADGTVVAGVALVDESSITAESCPVVRDTSELRSTVVAGSDVISDWLVIKVTPTTTGIIESVDPFIDQATDIARRSPILNRRHRPGRTIHRINQAR